MSGNSHQSTPDSEEHQTSIKPNYIIIKAKRKNPNQSLLVLGKFFQHISDFEPYNIVFPEILCDASLHKKIDISVIASRGVQTLTLGRSDIISNKKQTTEISMLAKFVHD